MSESTIPPVGIHEETLNTSAVGELRYTRYIPDEGKGPFPLVVALHYGFDRTRPFPAYYGRGILEGLILPALDSLGAIIAAPDSHGRAWTDPEIAGALLELTDTLIERHPIDPARTLLTGFSLGGLGTWHLLGPAAGRFRAGVSIAAAPTLDPGHPPAPVPTYVIHSEDDEIFAIARVREAVDLALSSGVPVHLETIRGPTHFEVPRYVEPLSAAAPWIEEQWRSARV